MFDAELIKNCNHWIFDMDGTLTVGAHDFEHIRRELGLVPQIPILEALHALPSEQSEPLWTKLNELEMFYAQQASMMRDADVLLQQLTEQGCKLAILTRNTMPVVMETLRACAIDHYFPPDQILDRDSCAPKPAPDGIEYLLELWQATAQDAVMVGDYLFDLQAGKGAGVTTIHLATRGGLEWPEFSDLRVHELAEIIDCL